MSYTLGKAEKLKSKKLIEQLFAEGKHVKAFPLRLIYLPIHHGAEFPIKAGFKYISKNNRIINIIFNQLIKIFWTNSHKWRKFFFFINLNHTKVGIGSNSNEYQQVDGKKF